MVNRMVTKGYQKGVYERVTKGMEDDDRRVPNGCLKIARTGA